MSYRKQLGYVLRVMRVYKLTFMQGFLMYTYITLTFTLPAWSLSLVFSFDKFQGSDT